MANQSVVSRLSASAGPIYLVARNNAGRLHQTSEPAAFDSFLMFLQPVINIPGIYSKTSSAILKRRGGHPTKNTAIDYQVKQQTLNMCLRGRDHLDHRMRHGLKFGHPFYFPILSFCLVIISDAFAIMKSEKNGLTNENFEVVNTLPVNIMPISYSSQNHGQSSYTSDDLPKNPVMALNQGSAVKSMNFHPVQKILFPFPGVAYSRHVVHVYSYHGGADIRNHLEFIFSTATDGKIKAWLYDNAGSRVDYDAPGRSSATMAYSADGTSCRVFLCGTNKEGESHLVEWNESEGAVKRNYNGLAKRSEGDVKLIPLTIDSWRLGMSSRSSSGTWIIATC
ncbi:topless-related protein [Salix suchowensis]|nr:topless-related protein [Salix suchowensis]